MPPQKKTTVCDCHGTDSGRTRPYVLYDKEWRICDVSYDLYVRVREGRVRGDVNELNSLLKGRDGNPFEGFALGAVGDVSKLQQQVAKLRIENTQLQARVDQLTKEKEEEVRKHRHVMCEADVDVIIAHVSTQLRDAREQVEESNRKWAELRRINSSGDNSSNSSSLKAQ